MDGHVTDFKTQGFTVFRKFYSAQQVATIRSIVEPEFEQIFRADPTAVRAKLGAPLEGSDGRGLNAVPGGLLKHHLWDSLEPTLGTPWGPNPLLLDMAERVMGPFVQLDAFGITCYPATDASNRGLRAPQGWHRDSNIVDRMKTYGAGSAYEDAYQRQMIATSSHSYKPPVGINMLCYLQDMTSSTGPLRFVRSSHLGWPPTPTTGEAWDRLQTQGETEQVLDLEAGDMCFMHGEMIHSGSQNTSADLRMYMSTFICRLGYPHRDDFGAPAVQRIRQRTQQQQQQQQQLHSQYLSQAIMPRLGQVQRFFGDVNAGTQSLRQEELSWGAMIEEEKKSQLPPPPSAASAARAKL